MSDVVLKVEGLYKKFCRKARCQSIYPDLDGSNIGRIKKTLVKINIKE